MRYFLTAVMVGLLVGCSGTRAAYRAADGLEQTAYVMNEHYLALVVEANLLKDSGVLNGSALSRTQELVARSRTVLQYLSNAAIEYEVARDAQTEAALTQAIANAAEQLAELVKAVNAASRGDGSLPGRRPASFNAMTEVTA